MVKNFVSRNLLYAVLLMLIFTGFGQAPVASYASTIDLLNANARAVTYKRPPNMATVESLPAFPIANMIALPATANPGIPAGPPDNVPPMNPPIDTPAFHNGLVNAPTTMPLSVPPYTLPGSSFGRTVVPVPAAIWLFGSGMLGLIAIARHKKTF